jgi:UV DNA damage repair endonuclease
MRISSDVFPLASHDKVGQVRSDFKGKKAIKNWQNDTFDITRYAIDFASNELAEVGALRDKYDHRLVKFEIVWFRSFWHDFTNDVATNNTDYASGTV